MRSSLFLVAGLATVIALVSAPDLVIGSVFLGAFVLVLWRLVVPRGGLMWRGGRR
ncbi:hypothetical protein [Nocardia mangyaensis]|uniref:hypothetical protein n=1 Tax=Nocardia mangyaensis TaxID=2213200 RepID=UPI00267546C3|nr:hypothetical protein [Nocardia mangyaensis]MDO3651176.1 hypothetical protein [Nocardia mangyaensis]